MTHLVQGPTGADRIREHSSPTVNERIDRQTASRLAEMSGASPVEIGKRIAALEREWDIDRALMAFFSLLGGAVFATALSRPPRRRKRNLFFLPLAPQLGFLFLHAVAGWCPPASLLRRLGFRSQQEIQWERYMLESQAARAGTQPAH